MKTFLEAKGDTAVFTFGRFNPPTTGHEKLIDALAKQQSRNAGSLMYVYASHSQDAKKNPLPHARKIAYMKKMFRKYAQNIITSNQETYLRLQQNFIIKDTEPLSWLLVLIELQSLIIYLTNIMV